MILKRRILAAKEALLGSAGILLAGFLIIPLEASVVGAQISYVQGASISILFFFARWIWLFLLRMWFSRGEE